MAQLAPFGFQVGQSRRSVNEYYVPASDTSTLAVGDPVRTDGNVFVGRLPDSRVSKGMLHVTKAAPGQAVRGVIVGIVAGPDANNQQSLPAVKTRPYCLLVNDNPQALWDVQADNAAPLSAMAGMYASYAVGAPLGSVSSTVVDSSTIGATVSDLLIAEVLRNDGANALLRVAFVQHEMAAAGGSPVTAAAVQSLVSGEGNFTASGYRTVLFADSMTSQHYVDTTPTCSYSVSTGVMTLTQSAHALPTGWPVDFYHRGYAALTAHVRKTVTRIDANTFSIQLDPGLSGVPDGALAGTGFARMPHRLASNGFFTWLQIASGWRFNLVYNGAQSGDRTDDNLARLERDCLAYEPHVVFMQTAGINDMGNGTPARDEETIFAAQKEIIQRILAVGARVVLLGMTPVASGEARATLQNMARVRSLNRRLEDWAKDYPRIVYFDAHRLIVDPTNTTGLADANLVKSTDFIHYSIRGAKKVADALWTQIAPLFPAPGDTLPTSAVDSMLTSAVTLTSPTRSGNTVTSNTTAHGFRTGERVKVYGGTSTVLNDYTTVTRIDADNLSFPVETTGADGAITGTVRLTRGRNMFGNPLLLTASGGTTSGPVTGTTAALVRTRVLAGSPTAVASVVARSDGFGNNQRLVITPAAADNRCSIELENSTTALVAQVKGGRRYFFQAHVTMTGVSGSNLSEMGFRLFMQWDGNNHSAFALDTYDSAPLNADWSGHVRTAEITLPAGVSVTQFYFEVAPRFSAAGTALTLEVGRIELVELE